MYNMSNFANKQMKREKNQPMLHKMLLQVKLTPLLFHPTKRKDQGQVKSHYKSVLFCTSEGQTNSSNLRMTDRRSFRNLLRSKKKRRETSCICVQQPGNCDHGYETRRVTDSMQEEQVHGKYRFCQPLSVFN